MKEKQLRKYEHILAISGVGVIAFGLWSIVKAAIYFILIPQEQLKGMSSIKELAELYNQGMTDREIVVLIAVVILLCLILDFSLRLYVGRSAFADGRRLKKKRFAYVVWAMFLAAGLVAGIVARCVQLYTGNESFWQRTVEPSDVSMLVDLTSLLALIEMIVAGIMVRRLRRELGTDGKEAA